jgi:hypothetical protein
MFGYYQLTRLNDDKCAIATDEFQSQQPLSFNTYYGYVPEKVNDYVAKITPTRLRQRQYWNGTEYVDVDTKLTHVPMTHNGAIRELYGRPFKTRPYKGASRMSIIPEAVDLETKLTFGTYTETKKLGDAVHESGVNRFIPLPEYGNPQRVDRVVLPIEWDGQLWAHGGTDTRDHVRRIGVQHFIGASYVTEDNTPPNN